MILITIGLMCLLELKNEQQDKNRKNSAENLKKIKLTTGQSEMLESLQKQALKIIFCDIEYHMSLILAGLNTLYSRRELILQRFYKQNIVHSSSCPNYLLP